MSSGASLTDLQASIAGLVMPSMDDASAVKALHVETSKPCTDAADGLILPVVGIAAVGV